jgi:lipopolysaccharide export system permease protein
MGSIGRYIFRTTFGAFLVICASVTALMWITQALRDIDLMTNQGQSIFVFIGITGLIVPLLVLIIAPIALMIAVAHVLNKLGNDSELIVMNAAGMPPWVPVPPFLAGRHRRLADRRRDQRLSLALGTCASLRRWATEVRADLVSNIVQPGRFIQLEAAADAAYSRAAPQRTVARASSSTISVTPKERATILAEQGTS